MRSKIIQGLSTFFRGAFGPCVCGLVVRGRSGGCCSGCGWGLLRCPAILLLLLLGRRLQRWCGIACLRRVVLVLHGLLRSRNGVHYLLIRGRHSQQRN